MFGEIAPDDGREIDKGVKAAAAQALAGQLGKERLDGVKPGAGGGGEVKGPARVPFEPGPDFGVLVGGVVVHHGLDQLARGHLALDGVEEADEFLMTVALHAAADHCAVQHVERREQRRGAVALVVVRHRGCPPWLGRQAGLGALKRLDLAFFIDGQHHCMRGRREVKADYIHQLGREGRIARELEGVHAVRS